MSDLSNIRQFETVVGDFSDYQSDIMDVCSSLHSVLSSLNDSWHGLHVMLIIFLRECYFCRVNMSVTDLF